MDNELNPIETETAILVNNINQQASVELGRGLAEMRSAQHKILMIVPATALFTFFIAASFGWSIAHRFIELRLDERLAERTHIARDLHDTMLQTFQGVLLKFYGLSVMLADRPDAQQKLEGLLGEARQAINEGREAVLGLRASTVIANDLARAFATLGEELAAKQDSHNPVAFRVEVQGETRDLHPILRDEVYRIACEALRNAFQHSGAARIEVGIHYDDRQFWVCVRDNGRGIDPMVLEAGAREGHYGMPGMHERARLASGRLVVRSRVNSGTEAEIIIPAARAYAKSRSPRAGLHFCEEELDESVSPDRTRFGFLSLPADHS